MCGPGRPATDRAAMRADRPDRTAEDRLEAWCSIQGGGDSGHCPPATFAARWPPGYIAPIMGRWLAIDGPQAGCEHTSTVGVVSRPASTLPAAVRRTTIAVHALEDPSWTIRSPSVCPHGWVARSGEHLAAWDAGLRTSSAWHSRRSFREHRQPTVNERNGWSTSSARCRRESPTWQSDIVSTFSRP